MDVIVLSLCSIVLWLSFFNAVFSIKETYRSLKKFDFEWFILALLSGVAGLFVTYVTAVIIAYGV